MIKPRILILGKLPPPYIGPAIATQVLLNSMLNDNFELVHINTGLNRKIESMGNYSLIKVLRVLGIYLDYLFKLIRYKPNLILIPNGQTSAAFFKDSVFILLGRIAGSKILLHLRGSGWKNWLDNTGTFTKWYVRKFVSLTSGVIVLGEKLRYLFYDHFKASRIFVVPNGADYEFESMIRRGSNLIRILFLSNLIPAKGVKDVLKAGLLLKDNGIQNVLFTFAGSWKTSEFEKECRDFVTDNNLPVIFLPPVSGDEKMRIYSDAHIFVFPPRMPEGHPWVIIEAMAAGLPIITTDQGAITESVSDNLNGYIVKPYSPEEIAGKIKFLIENPEYRIKMGHESRRLYETSFTEEKMVEKLTVVFNRVIFETY